MGTPGERQLFLMRIPNRHRDITKKMVKAIELPSFPRREQQVAIAHPPKDYTLDPETGRDFGTIVDANIGGHQIPPGRAQDRLSIMIIFGEG